MSNKINTETFKAALLAEREEIGHLSEVSEGDRQTVVLDQTTVGRLSRMDALQTQAMALETERRRHVELQKIDAALQRIEAGDYGFCVHCGEEIEIKRLENDPTVPTCISCAQEAGS